MSVKGYVSHISPEFEKRRKLAKAPVKKTRVKSKPVQAPRGAKPQTSPLNKSQVKNAAGGYVFKLPILERLKRFLILGSDRGTYYAGAREHTKMNADVVKEALRQDGPGALALIRDVSVKNLAPKNDPAIFALAIAASTSEKQMGKQICFSSGALALFTQVCRTGTHKLQFAAAVNTLRGWGPALRHAFAQYYETTPVGKLAYQMLKYQNREGFTQRDILRLTHPNPERAHGYTKKHHAPLARKALFKYVVKGEAPKRIYQGNELIVGIEAVKKFKKASTVAHLISEYKLTREMVPTPWLSDPVVQEALLQGMPAHALIRNLASFTKSGLIKPMSKVARDIVEKLGNQAWLAHSRVHPMALYLAARTYARGHGERGGSAWTPVQTIVTALEDAFYKSFGNVKATRKNILLAIDMSGSMGQETSNGISAVELAAAQALVVLNSEPNVHLIGFNTVVEPLDINTKMTIRQVQNRIAANGGTDCSQPFRYAVQEKLEVDAFIVLTDNETWAGNQGHPQQWLTEYRKRHNSEAKAICVSVTATPGSISDPKDEQVLQVVGFDSSVMQVMNAFIGGEGDEQVQEEEAEFGDD